MGNAVIANAPVITLPRSSRDQFETLPTTFKHGQIVPLVGRLMYPGETLILPELDKLLQLNTPKVPFSGHIKCECNAFFVPLRLLCPDWEKFNGANPTGYGAPNQISLKDKYGFDLFAAKNDGVVTGIGPGSVAHYFRKPYCEANGSLHCYVLPFKEAAYHKIVSDHYRPTMFVPPFLIDYDKATTRLGYIGLKAIYLGDSVTQGWKSFDYFTSNLESPTYGDPVTLPLGEFADVSFAFSGGEGLVEDWENENVTLTMIADASGTEDEVKGTINAGVKNPTNDEAQLVARADLRNATAASIITLRNAVALERYKELSNYGGSTYWGQLVAHYGVRSPDASLQRSQHIGSVSFMLNVNSVTAMSTTSLGELGYVPLGTRGAISVTGNNRGFKSFAATEFGYYIVLCHTTVLNQVYTQGVLREDFAFEITDYFHNEFAHVGDQKTFKKEIMMLGNAADDEVWGYNEGWSFEKYRQSGATGYCDPNVPGAIPEWTLANKFAVRPTLNDEFLREDRDLVASRLYATEESSYDYLLQLNIHWIDISEIPTHTLPGLMDHIGNI